MRFACTTILLLLLFPLTFYPAAPLRAQSSIHATSAGAKAWVGTWAASQQVPEPQNALPADDLRDATLRQIVHLSIGGSVLRIHISNVFGTASLHFTSVHIAHPISASSAAIDPASDRALTFSGSLGITVPAGAEYISDPVNYAAAPLSNLAITFHLDTPPAQETSHPGSRATSYYTHGDEVSASDLPNAKHVDHWFQISAVDVLAPAHAASIVALGDSITDGHATTTNGNDRWTDDLARRLQASSAARDRAYDLGVLNQGIGGNHLLTDGLGPNVLARLDRDVLAQTGKRWVILLEGVNDLGGLTLDHEATPAEHALLVHGILGAYQQIILRAHADGVRIYGATITPYMGSGYYHPGPASEADRQQINAWIRTPGHFDGIIDFDKAVRDPQQPGRLSPAFDSGDHLHPSPSGYQAMADAIALSLFRN